MHQAAVAYLEQVNTDSHDLYRRVSRAALWMESTCNFMKETQAEVSHLFRVNTSSSAGNISTDKQPASLREYFTHKRIFGYQLHPLCNLEL